MKLYQMTSGADLFMAAELPSGTIDLTRALQRLTARSGIPSISTIQELIRRPDASALLKEAAEFVQSGNITDELSVPARARVLAPISRPGKVLGMGKNYPSGKEAAKPNEPVVFLKASSSVIGPDEEILLPTAVGVTSFEAELGVVIGRAGKRIDGENAMEHVFGYTIVNDVTALELLRQDRAAQQPWTRAKSYDTFTPCGPCIVTADEVGRTVELDILCRVNGEVKQHGNTRDLIFTIPEQIEFISSWTTLEPGDLIATGAPPGSGPLVDGDRVECEIAGIGVLANTARAER